MKTKKSFRRSALPIISVLAAAIISLTSVTFAWFSSGNFATVEQITVDVESTGGLQISLEAIGGKEDSWSNNVAVPNAAKNKTLSPVSTTRNAFALTGDNKGTLSFFKASYDKTYDRISNIEATSDAKSFVAFDLYFLNSEIKAKNVDLTGTVVASLTGMSHTAVRIAFVKHGKASSIADGVTDANFVVTDDYSVNALSPIYEPNAERHTDKGMTDYKANGGVETDEKFAYKGLEGICSATQYVDRFTGDVYNITEGINRTIEQSVAEGSVYYNKENKQFENYETAVDFSKIVDAETANQLFIANTKVYKVVEGSYTEVKELADFQNSDLSFYLFAPVDTFLLDSSKKVMDENPTVTETDTSATFFTLDAQSVTKITVYIWLEGQDVDCEDTIASHAFNVSFKFNATVVGQEG